MAGSRAPQSYTDDRCTGGPPDPSGWCDDLGMLDRLRVSACAAEDLALIIEQEILPRLMLVHRLKGPLARDDGEAGGKRVKCDPRTIARFTQHLIDDDVDAISAFVARQLDRGMAASALCLEVLAPAAKRLGRLWERDEIDFVSVTLALNRLHAVLSVIRTGPTVEPGVGGRRALLVPMPGDTHAFGVAVVSEFFRASGWLVSGSGMQLPADIISAAATQNFTIIGISLGSEVLYDDLAALIQEVRCEALNKGVAVLVGGPAFNSNLDRAGQLGADACPKNAREAVQVAERFLERQTNRASGRA